MQRTRDRLRTWQTRSLYFWRSHSKCSGTASNTQRLFIVVVGFYHHIPAYPGVPCSLSLVWITHALFPHLISTSSTQGSDLQEQIPDPITCSLDQSSQSPHSWGWWFGDDVGLAITGPVTRVKRMTLGLGCMHYSRVETKLGRCQELKRTGTSANSAFGCSCFLEGNFMVYLIKTFHFDQRCCFDFSSMKYKTCTSKITCLTANNLQSPKQDKI